MGLWTSLEGLLLLANALSILNEDRFLARRGWMVAEMAGARRRTLEGQVIGFIHASQFSRLLLVLFNLISVVVKFFSR